jgi:hypothetical protein
LWKKRRERMRSRRVGFRGGEGLAWDVNVKEVEGFEDCERPEPVIVLRLRERRSEGVMGLERWKLDRMVVENFAAPRAPDNEVQSIFADNGEGRG